MRKIFMAAAIYLMAVSCGTAPQAPEQNVANDKNEVIETILSRRSVRAYKDQAVPKELIDQVLECGVYAANAMNAQQWEVRVVESKAWIDKATEAYKQSVKGTPAEKMVTEPSFKNMFRNAPAVIFIGHKPSKYTAVDCGLMAENMMLAAQSLGLGTVCMASPVMFLTQPAGAEFLSSLSFSEGYEPLICIGIGYADEAPAAKPRNKDVIKYIE